VHATHLPRAVAQRDRAGSRVQSTSLEHSTQVLSSGAASAPPVKQRGFPGSLQSSSTRHATQDPPGPHLGRFGSVHSESTVQCPVGFGGLGGGATDATARLMKPVFSVVHAQATTVSPMATA
jgi:hypothetical protein